MGTSSVFWQLNCRDGFSAISSKFAGRELANENAMAPGAESLGTGNDLIDDGSKERPGQSAGRD